VKFVFSCVAFDLPTGEYFEMYCVPEVIESDGNYTLCTIFVVDLMSSKWIKIKGLILQLLLGLFSNGPASWDSVVEQYLSVMF
jgi:hypothetical protein